MILGRLAEEHVGVTTGGQTPQGASRRPARGQGVVLLGSCDVIAFTAAADLSRARTFYEQTLGLPLVSQDDFACVFNANGTMLRVTAVPHVSRVGYTVLGWRVRDIEEAVRGLAARGVVFQRHDGMDQDEHGVWAGPGGGRLDRL